LHHSRLFIAALHAAYLQLTIAFARHSDKTNRNTRRKALADPLFVSGEI
jgi:hypothetical protein